MNILGQSKGLQALSSIIRKECPPEHTFRGITEKHVINYLLARWAGLFPEGSTKEETRLKALAEIMLTEGLAQRLHDDNCYLLHTDLPDHTLLHPEGLLVINTIYWTLGKYDKNKEAVLQNRAEVLEAQRKFLHQRLYNMTGETIRIQPVLYDASQTLKPGELPKQAGIQASVVDNPEDIADKVLPECRQKYTPGQIDRFFNALTGTE